jgi:hypothetical protein
LPILMSMNCLRILRRSWMSVVEKTWGANNIHQEKFGFATFWTDLFRKLEWLTNSDSISTNNDWFTNSH